MRILSIGLLISGLLGIGAGCHNPLNRTAGYGDGDSFSARLGISSDDPAELETGKGHSASLASELADRRHAAGDSKSSSKVERLLKSGYDADVHGRSQEARMYYEQVLDEVPKHPEAHHRLGILADQLGDFAGAERHYQTALRGKPNDADLLNDLGYSCFLQGRAEESERYLNQALKLEPRHPHVQENLSLLYDQDKAETVLMSQMGPRQTEATLARLFHQSPPADDARYENRPPRLPEPIQERPRTAQNQTGELPQNLEELQQKMRDARLRSIAQRQQRSAPGHSLEHQQAGPPQLPAETIHQSPPHESVTGLDVPTGRINDAFRNIDQSGHSQGRIVEPAGYLANRSTQVSSQYDPRIMTPSAQPPQEKRLTPESQRAAFPQWNAQPQNWPEPPADVSGHIVQQAGYTEPARMPPANLPYRRSLPSAAERAAEIGMAAGPGAMFPQWSSETGEPEVNQNPLPAVRSLPGTNSRVNGAMYVPPNSSSSPPQWPSSPLGQNQWAADQERSSEIQQLPHEANRPAEVYDRMRNAQNVQFNQDQSRLAASPELMTAGPPARQAIPGTFDPNEQPWPAYTREQYDTRQMDQPPTGYNGPVIVPGTPGGQADSFNNSAMPAAPQENLPRW